MHCDQSYLASRGTVLVPYWVVLTDGISKPICTATNAFSNP